MGIIKRIVQVTLVKKQVEECEVTVDNITSIEDSTTSHTVSNSPKERRVTRRRTCHRQSLAPSQVSASSRRKKQKKSMRNSTINCAKKTQDLIMEDNEDSNTANHTIIVPDTQVENVTPYQDKKKKKSRFMSNITAAAHKHKLSQNGTGAVPKGSRTKYCIPHCKYNGMETAAAELLRCGMCMQWVHPICAGDSQEDAAHQGHVPSVVKCHYTCPNC